MQTALALAAEQAALQGAAHIHCMKLRVGRLSGVEPAALMFAFEALAPGTPAEGARLEIEMVPTVCHCSGCASEFEPEDFIFTCPRCGQFSSEVRSGQELELASLEVS